MTAVLEDRFKDPELCFTSLIDIVFLLLIFFMCATQFKKVEEKLDAFLPFVGPCPPPAKVIPPEDLTIFVRDDAVLRQSDSIDIKSMRRATFYLASRDATPVNDVNRMLPVLRQLAEDPGRRVLIAPYDEGTGKDQLVPFFNVVKVVDACKASGISNIAFQAPRTYP